MKSGSTLMRWVEEHKHVCCRGVAARAGSVHLMYSDDPKRGQPEGRGQHKPKTLSCSSRTPILNEI